MMMCVCPTIFVCRMDVQRLRQNSEGTCARAGGPVTDGRSERRWTDGRTDGRGGAVMVGGRSASPLRTMAVLWVVL